MLTAVADIDARVLLTVGRRFDISEFGELPSNVHIEPWVDQAGVFAEAEVVVCHGGSGTTFGALAAGVPVVVVPLFADQFANGHKVAEAKAGFVLDRGLDSDGVRRPLCQADAPGIAEAIETVRGSSFREHAQRIAVEMAHAPTVGDLLSEIVTTR